MTERETLDREIYVLGRIIKDDEAALRLRKTSVGDRRLLKLQIGIRTALNVGLMERRGKPPSTAVPGGRSAPRASTPDVQPYERPL
jgi:hypothetical protein